MLTLCVLNWETANQAWEADFMTIANIFDSPGETLVSCASSPEIKRGCELRVLPSVLLYSWGEI